MKLIASILVILSGCSCAPQERPTTLVMSIQHQYNKPDRSMFMDKAGVITDRHGATDNYEHGCQVDERATTEIIFGYYQDEVRQENLISTPLEVEWLAKVSGKHLTTFGYAVENDAVQEYALSDGRLFKLRRGAISALSAIQRYACWNDKGVDGPFH